MTKKTFIPTFTSDDFEVLNKESGYQGYFRLDKYQIRHRLFNGGWGDPVSREVFERGKAAGALLFDPDLNKIVLIEQFRMGISTHTQYPWILEIVAGIIEPNEKPEDVVRRESEEEAGLTIKALLPIVEYWVSPGASSEKLSLFLAQVDASDAGGIFGLAEEGEDIKVWTFTLDEAFQLVDDGKIINAPTLIALQWLRIHEAEVRRLWNVKV